MGYSKEEFKPIQSLECFPSQAMSRLFPENLEVYVLIGDKYGLVK